jgi:hypothetical protein
MRMICLGILLFLSACSGYFPGGGNKNPGNQSVSLEMSDGSGTLSSLNHNDITPFLYRSGGRAWLFFASDRAGHYNIYFAEMDSNGRFFNLTMMDSNVNSSYDTFSPVVQLASYYIESLNSYFTNLYISYLVVSNDSTNLYSTAIDNNFAGMSPASLAAASISATHISLFDKEYGSILGSAGTSYLAVSTGTSLCSNYAWSPLGLTNWTTYQPSINSSQSGQVFGIDGYTAPSPYFGQIFLADIVNNSQHQLYFGGLWVSNTSGTSHVILTNIFKISDYSSSYDDGYPCIDLTTMKVYFSSKRFGKGFWNLYRFNIKTFDKEIQWDNSATNAPNITSG